MADTLTSVTVTPINLAQAMDPSLITDGTLTGNGIFDVWMRAIGAHLLREYKEGRITGDEYAKAYIAILNNLLNAAVQFLTQDASVFMQLEKLKYELPILEAQLKLADKDLELKGKQIDNATKDLELKGKQLDLLAEQAKAAQAQYKDTIDGVPVGGVLGKQMAIYTAQAKGFKDQALQAAAQMMINTWNVRRNTDEGLQTTPESHLQDINIGNAIKAMFESTGINVS